jgi:Fuc2NAc and GlcNAc transferase
MTTEWIIVVCVAAATFVATAWLTGLARDYAVRRAMIDVAGPRASHSAPTPRGGGIAIVAVGLVTMAGIGLALGAPSGVLIATLGGGAAVALVGWLDDHGHVAAPVRFGVHLAAAGWAVAWLGAFPVQELIGIKTPIAAVDAVLSVILIGWSINLFNFMDGIDGIAASQAAMVFGGAALLVMMTLGMMPWLVAILIALTAAVLGFLMLWNWPPAKIFMGDACSGFLGFLIGLLTVGLAQLKPSPALLGVATLVLYGVFLVDATVTLITRLIRGKSPAVAHRSHAYQALSRRWGRHLPVTLGTIAVGLLWLFPWSYAIVSGLAGPVSGAMGALVPLAALAIAAGAGRDDA